MDELLDWIEEDAIASGSIGQIHRGCLSKRGAEICGMQQGKVVAIKVKHPNVSLSIQRDFALMMWVANKLEFFPAMRKLRLEESLKQFAAPLREQVRPPSMYLRVVCSPLRSQLRVERAYQIRRRLR